MWLWIGYGLFSFALGVWAGWQIGYRGVRAGLVIYTNIKSDENDSDVHDF